MNNKQESIEKMSVTASTFLSAHESIVTELPNFSKYFTIIVDCNNKIKVLAVQQEMNTSGNTTNKNLIRASLTTLCMDIVNRTKAYATNEENTVLLSQISYTQSDLNKSSDTKLLGICQVIYDCASAHVEALNTYGISTESFKKLQTSINDFSIAIPKVRIGATETSEATQQLQVLFNTLALNWDKMDTLIEMLRISMPPFYDEYQKVRMIIETGVGYLAIKGLVSDAVTGEPIKGVTVDFYASRTINGKPYMTKVTAEKGGLNIKSMQADTYRVVLNKQGYNELSTSISVNDGETSQLIVSITKI